MWWSLCWKRTRLGNWLPKWKSSGTWSSQWSSGIESGTTNTFSSAGPGPLTWPTPSPWKRSVCQICLSSTPPRSRYNVIWKPFFLHSRIFVLGLLGDFSDLTFSLLLDLSTAPLARWWSHPADYGGHPNLPRRRLGGISTDLRRIILHGQVGDIYIRQKKGCEKTSNHNIFLWILGQTLPVFLWGEIERVRDVEGQSCVDGGALRVAIGILLPDMLLHMLCWYHGRRGGRWGRR